MWTKLRPGVRQFLKKAAQSYELWIHTNGVLFFIHQLVVATCFPTLGLEAVDVLVIRSQQL